MSSGLEAILKDLAGPARCTKLQPRKDEKMYLKLMEITRGKLASVEIEDLNLRGNPILLSVDPSAQLLKDREGMPEIRICNFELLRRTEQ